MYARPIYFFIKSLFHSPGHEIVHIFDFFNKRDLKKEKDLIGL